MPDLIGRDLDRAVAEVLGWVEHTNFDSPCRWEPPAPNNYPWQELPDWSDLTSLFAGPVAEMRERGFNLTLVTFEAPDDNWYAETWGSSKHADAIGDTPAEAILRAILEALT